MRLKIKNIWKIFLSTAISASMAATNAFAFVTIRKGDVDTETLQREYRAANPTKSSIKILSSPFVKGKTVYNAYNRADNKFDFIHGEADAANMGNTMTYAHTAIFSTSLLSCVCTEATNAYEFGYPIGNGNEFALIDKLIKTIHAKIHTPGTTDDDKNAYKSLLKLIHLTATHIWFLRCPEGYGECRTRWATHYQATLSPFFHKIGSEFVYNNGSVRIVPDMNRSTISSKVFGSIGHPGLRKKLIKAFTISECAWESKVFENSENSLDTSLATKRLYDMLNEALRALVMYGLGKIGAENDEQLAKYYNSFLPKDEQVNAETTTIEDIYDALATSLGNAIEAVKGCYQIGNGVSNIIKWRCEVERYTSGRIKFQWGKTFEKLVKDKDDLLVWPKGVPRPQPPAVPTNFTPPPAKRPRVGASPVLNQGQQQQYQNMDENYEAVNQFPQFGGQGLLPFPVQQPQYPNQQQYPPVTFYVLQNTDSPVLNQGQQQQYLPAITGPNTYVSPIQQNEIYAPVALQQQPLMPGQYMRLDQGQQTYPIQQQYQQQDQYNATDTLNNYDIFEPDNGTDTLNDYNIFEPNNATDTLNNYDIFEPDNGTNILNNYDIFEDNDYSSPLSSAFFSPNTND